MAIVLAERLKRVKQGRAAVAKVTREGNVRLEFDDNSLLSALYGDHPYGHLGLGTTASLTRATVDETRLLHAALFAPAGATLVVVVWRVHALSAPA